MIVAAVAGFVILRTLLRGEGDWRKRMVEPTRRRKRQRMSAGKWVPEW